MIIPVFRFERFSFIPSLTHAASNSHTRPAHPPIMHRQAGICSTFGLENATALLRAPAKTFVVGKLTAKHASPVSFFQDRCTYSFFHPFQSAEIQMVMYVRIFSTTSIKSSSPL